ncbi:TPA: restriction endonuclease subunit S [Vibrio parahaemolyticus]|nr:restriction endonuclease subunit S [Vibrio parahaemolyticus]
MSSLPKLRLSEFSDSDTYFPHKFDDVFSFSSGKNIKQNESSPEFSTPCVRYGELYHMYGEVITRTINNTNLEHSELTFSAGNEILLPSAGEDPLDIGSASALTLEGVAIGRTINVLRPKGTIDYSHIYVSYYINEKLRKRISQLARGASISNVYNSDLKTLKACLPSFPEQQKVASFLSKVDEKIALLTEKKTKLNEYKKGVMQQLFNGKWEEQDGQLTFVPPTLRFKADDGSEFSDWVQKRITEIAHTYIGLVTTMTAHYVERNGVFLIRNSDIKQNKIKTNGLINLSHDFAQEHKNRALQLNDIVTVHTGDIGVSAVITEKLVGSQGFATLNTRLTSECTSAKYLCWYYNSFSNIKFAYSMATGDGRSNYNLKDFNRAMIPIPEMAEQTKIANFLSAIDQKVELVNSELEKAKEWKKGLLQQMFV